MHSAGFKLTIKVEATVLWKTIKNFGSVEKYLPWISSSHVDGNGVGAVRTAITHDGIEIQSQLECIDEKAKILKYAIINSSLPVNNYLGTMRVKDVGFESSEMEWSAVFEVKDVSAEEEAKKMETMFELGIKGLEKYLTTHNS